MSRPKTPPAARVAEIYAALDEIHHDAFWHWMPDVVSSPMDIIVGAILVQHTTWQSAERALEALRNAGKLDIDVLAAIPDDDLIPLIRVAGTATVKARRLRAIATTIRAAGGLDAFLALSLGEMRSLLLATHGVGPETADAIALYAAGLPTFVVDAYTIRLFRRLGLGPDRNTYDAWRAYFMDATPDAIPGHLQRYHAWIVLHGKALCRTKPRCPQCPLLPHCPHGAASVQR